VPLYNTAEPFWTVSVEIWIYVAAGLFFFCLLCRERLRQRWLLPMLALSLPVAVWNAAAGGGKSLSLIWLLGAVAACGLARLSGPHSPRSVWLALWLVVFGAAGLAGRVAKVGFDGFDLQTVALMAAVLFGVLVGLAQVHSVPRWLHRSCSFLASYSYSLYLIHNTALVVAYEALPGSPRWLSIGVGVLAAHGVAVLLYLGFEQHHRRVAQWLRPRFERALLLRDAALLPAPEPVPASRAVPNAAHP
jgi:peptidoglycan/LPS O-acetylase OafA/YrhL